MTHRNIFLLGLGVVVLVGIGLCIVGAFFAPLLVPGGVILGASMGVLSKEFKNSRSRSDEVNPIENEPQMDEHPHHDLLFRYQMVQNLEVHEGDHQDADYQEVNPRNRP